MYFKRTLALGILLGLLMGFQAYAQIELRGSEFSGDAGPWGNLGASTLSLTARPGYIRVSTPANTFGGIALTGGMPVNTYPPPWHMEVALERPMNVVTGIGFYLPSEGYQFLQISLLTPYGGRTALTRTDSWGGPKPPLAGPDTSGIPEASLAGARLIFYIGVVNDTTMRYGVRASESDAWSFAPDYNVGLGGLGLLAAPVYFPDWTIMTYNRDDLLPLYGQAGVSAPLDVDIDYVVFSNTLDTIVPVELSAFSIE